MDYTPGSLELLLDIKYDALAKETVLSKPDDIEEMLGHAIKHEYTNDHVTFKRKATLGEFGFRPCGEKVGEYKLKEDVSALFASADELAKGAETVFEVYVSNFEDPACVEYHRRLQTFLMWYIEAASYIEEDDLRWNIYTLYSKTVVEGKERFCIVGYATAYKFYLIPDSLRMRISQFFIFPQYQGQGHGHRLYSKMYELFADDPTVRELTVEDPNPDFQRLRDTCDLKFIVDSSLVGELPLPFVLSKVVPIAKRLKISRKQMERLAEIAIFYRESLNFASNKNLYKRFRLQVKKRLYRQNEDELEGMTVAKRLETLDLLYREEETEYKRIFYTVQRLLGPDATRKVSVESL